MFIWSYNAQNNNFNDHIVLYSLDIKLIIIIILLLLLI